MTKNEIIAKVDAELKAQGINATSEQIESALSKVANKQELNADDLDNVAGGFNPAALIPYIPDAINTIKNLFGDKDKKDGDGGSGGGAGGDTTTNTLNQQNNTNNQGVQANQQGGSGTQKNVQSIQTQGDVSL